MTREEIVATRQYQLTGATIEYCRKEHPHYDGEALGEITDAFEAGAEWEHKRLVEKVCKWIDDVDISKYLSCIFSGAVNISFISDDFIRDFKKAMEE